MRLFAVIALLAAGSAAQAATVNERYYAHPASHDSHGVIAPWHTGLDGQCGFRVRIAAETMKRFPWVGPMDGRGIPAPAPQWVYSGYWKIDDKGVIAATPGGWDGDVAQRSASMLFGLADYYRYSGDPWAKATVSVLVDRLIEHFQTEGDAPNWPGLLKSGCCYVIQLDGSSHPIMQLDLIAQVATGVVKAYHLCGNRKWLEAAKRWGDLFASNCDLRPGKAPWGRYANPDSAIWNDRQTGGVVFICEFLDELIRAGYTGEDSAIVKARDAGRAYLRDTILPAWTVDDTWGRYYWDWENQVTAICPPAAACRYMMDHKDAFPNWKNDVRNILSLYINRVCTTDMSRGDVYSGAWQYPESTGCCGHSLQYPTYEIASVFGRYGSEADSEWAREIARRSLILVTYDARDNGVVEDGIYGGQIAAVDWLNLSHPWPLRHLLYAVAYLPDLLGANRENHIVGSSSVIRSVVYGDGKIKYTVSDASNGVWETLRLAFAPRWVTADGKPLQLRSSLEAPGYTIDYLSNGDVIVRVRHDGAQSVVIEGDDPQAEEDDRALVFDGDWAVSEDAADLGGSCRVSADKGAAAEISFKGNQVRLIGRADPSGGLADVYLDGEKQLAIIDCWAPARSCRQVIFYRGGLAPGTHRLRIVARGAGNPLSSGAHVYLDGAQWSDAERSSGFGEGGGPTSTQRMVFGYTGRAGLTDSEGNVWMPGTEYVVRLPGALPDVVESTWWTEPRRYTAPGVSDPELYLYGVHAPVFTVNVTVGPGRYYARAKFMAVFDHIVGGSGVDRCISVFVNGRPVVEHFDPVATGGGWGRPFDLVFNDIEPVNGIIEITFKGSKAAGIGNGEAFVQALEIGPGEGGEGAAPVLADTPRPGERLTNPDFESVITGFCGPAGANSFSEGWTAENLGPGFGYVWREADFIAHPNWGGPKVRRGNNAIRTHTDGNGHVRVWQDVIASPGETYEASVWVCAVDLHGKGFGTSKGDSAGLILQELGADGKVLVEHSKAEVTEAGPFTHVRKSITTGEGCAAVRFILDTVIGANYTEGHVTYDDCGLRQSQHQ